MDHLQRLGQLHELCGDSLPRNTIKNPNNITEPREPANVPLSPSYQTQCDSVQ